MKDTMPIEHKFLQAFQLLVSSVRIHQDNNQILTYSVEQLVDITRQLIKGNDEVFLITTEGGFYLQEEKLQFKGHTAVFADKMLQFFKKRKLSGLKFNELIFKASVKEITAFARFLNQAEKYEDPPAWLEKVIKENNLAWVEHVRVSQISLKGGQEKGTAIVDDSSNQMEHSVETPPVIRDEGNKDRESEQHDEPPVKNISDIKRKNIIQTYGYALMALKEVSGEVSSNKKASIQKSIRLVQNMIDMVADDNQMFFGLSTIRDYDDYTYTHSLNVAILSICLGHQIGMSKSLLENLSLSALFHDLGKIDVPVQVLNKPGRLTDTEFQLIKKHPIDSLRRIVKLRTTRKKKASMMLAPFEHHLKYDLSGYPKKSSKQTHQLVWENYYHCRCI